LRAASSFGASSLRATNGRVKFSRVPYAGERHLTAELTVRGFLPSSRRWLRRPWWEATVVGETGGGTRRGYVRGRVAVALALATGEGAEAALGV